MTVETHPQITQFFDAVRAWMPAYVHSTFAFVALRHNHEFVILGARLRLSATIDRPRMRPVATANLVATEVALAGDVDDVSSLVNTALAGSQLVVGEHLLRFLADKTSGYLAYHDHASAPQRGWLRSSYLDFLRLSGARRWDLVNHRLPELERELQPEGYRSLDRVMADFGFGLSVSDVVSIEIAAEPVVHIAADSNLRSQAAEIEVTAPVQLSTEHLTVTLVDAQSDGRLFRRSICGREFVWSRVGRDWAGRCTISLDKPAILTCRVLYAGSLHDEVELCDPSTLPNLRRTIVELADPGLQRLQGPITAPKNNQEQNEFEAGFAVLLYMLGFDSVRIGGVKKLSDAADIFATTPSGQLLVVECTTAVLNPQDKLGKLLARIENARAQLSATISRIRPDQIIGLVAIPKLRSDLGAEWRTADERGVIILCRPEIEQALAMTRFPLDPNAVLNEWLGLRLRLLMTEGLRSPDHL